VRAGVHAAGRAPAPPANGPLPIRVVGLLESSHGIGASARLAIRALESLGAWVEPVNLALGLDWRARLPGPAPAAAWIFHLNPPEMPNALAALGPRRVLGPRYGVWAWELPQAPPSWRTDARLVDEVWAPSRYTAEAFSRMDRPVRVVPHPLFPEDYAGIEPAPKTAGFRAVALFDFNSSTARKNPEGAIEAFRRAFGDDPACELIIKTQNGSAHPRALAGLRARAGERVRIVDESWPYAEVKRLIAGADVLVSLHRAEGFGLVMAEAMALGVPVVATAATGNLDFMDETCGLLIPAGSVAVDDPQGVYRGQIWAEPDLGAAAEALKRLRAQPGLRAALADAGRRRVAERLSPRAWLATLPEAVQAAVLSGR
jgi:glycosyltransferase involved in cell wall biosynthesis